MKAGDTEERVDPVRMSRRGRLAFLARDSIVYGVAGALSKALGLITFPLLARHLSVGEFGTLDYFLVVGTLLGVFFVFGQDSAVARFYYEYDDRPERRRVISQSLWFQLAGLALVLPFLYLGAPRVGSSINDAADAVALLRLVILQVPFLVLIGFSQNILKWTFRRNGYLVMSVGLTLVTVVGLVLGVVWADVGVHGVIVIHLVVQVFFGLLGLWLIRGWLTVPSGWTGLGELVRFAVPMGVICTVGAFVPALERGVVSDGLGAVDLGLYAAGAKVGMLMTLPVQAFQTAWGPFSLAIFREPDASVTYNAVLKGFTIGAVVAVMVLVALAEPVVQILASGRYSGASSVVFAIAFGVAIESIGWILGIGITLSKRSYLNLISYSVFLAVSFGGMWAFLPRFGIVGVAWGAMLGRVAKVMVESVLAQRVHPLEWRRGAVVALLGATLVLGGLGQIVMSAWGPVAMSVAAGLSALLVGSAGWWGVLSRHERVEFQRLVARRLPTGVGSG